MNFAVEILDKNLVRVGAVTRPKLSITQTLNEAGEWSLDLPLSFNGGGFLKSGGGIRVRYDGDDYFSGMITKIEKKESSYLISGKGYLQLLEDYICFANPAVEIQNQDKEFYSVNGKSETVIKTLVTANLKGLTSRGCRLSNLLDVVPDRAAGETVVKTDICGQSVLEIAKELAQDMILSVNYEGGRLKFDCRVPEVKTEVVLSKSQRSVLTEELNIEAPGVTKCYVIGDDKKGVPLTSSESDLAKETWGRNIEKSVSQVSEETSSGVPSDKYSEGQKELSENGRTKYIAIVEPKFDRKFMSYWKDYRLGDYVNLIFNGKQLAQITTVSITIDGGSEAIAIGVGDIIGADTKKRIESLEKQSKKLLAK